MTTPLFKLKAPYQAAGDQPEAIRQLVRGVVEGNRFQTLLGVTGSGKTFTMASVIASLNRPALIFAPNKTLAAQLFSEFRQFFPENAVEYFVSYYDYYHPEAYVPERDLFIDKDAKINEELEKLRLSATRNLLERRDTIVIASVSCIYGLGDPSSYLNLSMHVKVGDTKNRSVLLRDLVAMQYVRNQVSFDPGTFRIRGDVAEVCSAYEDIAYRIELWGDKVERLSKIDPLRGSVIEKVVELTIWPKSHYVTTESRLNDAIREIKKELIYRESELQSLGCMVECQRLHQRTSYDIEMMKEMGYCSGIENYSRFLDGRNVGEPPHTLLDYFPEDFILFMDESHVAIGQLRGMYLGDKSRKQTLVDYGFRLPSALDNRPLKFEEFEKRVNQLIFVSATPGDYELVQSGGLLVEQVVRPTGLVDPIVEIRPAKTQIDDLLEEIRKVVARDERVLVTVLTKKLAEQITVYYRELGVKIEYLHSEIATVERVELLKNLRMGIFDVLVGINLLREGLDLPEVSLVAILDADKEGYLRSNRSLIQTIGRAARNLNGKAILYGDRTTDSMRLAIYETERRRAKQAEYNKKYGISPTTTKRHLDDVMGAALAREFITVPGNNSGKEDLLLYLEDKVFAKEASRLESEMRKLAGNMNFERAAEIRDRLLKVKRERLLK